jgi:hypothetical protein
MIVTLLFQSRQLQIYRGEKEVGLGLKRLAISGAKRIAILARIPTSMPRVTILLIELFSTSRRVCS